jgi:hypothetical protein
VSLASHLREQQHVQLLVLPFVSLELLSHQLLQAATQHNVTVTQHNVTIIEHNVTVTQHNVTVTQRNVTVTQHNVTVTQHNVTVTQHNVKVTQRNVRVTQHNVTVTQHNVTIIEHNGTRLTHPTPLKPVHSTLTTYNQRLATDSRMQRTRRVHTACYDGPCNPRAGLLPSRVDRLTWLYSCHQGSRCTAKHPPPHTWKSSIVHLTRDSLDTSPLMRSSTVAPRVLATHPPNTPLCAWWGIKSVHT